MTYIESLAFTFNDDGPIFRIRRLMDMRRTGSVEARKKDSKIPAEQQNEFKGLKLGQHKS